MLDLRASFSLSSAQLPNWQNISEFLALDLSFRARMEIYRCLMPALTSLILIPSETGKGVSEEALAAYVILATALSQYYAFIVFLSCILRESSKRSRRLSFKARIRVEDVQPATRRDVNIVCLTEARLGQLSLNPH